MVVLSKENYVAIADILKLFRPFEIPPGRRQILWDNIVESLANYFRDNNPRFDGERFLEAAGATFPFSRAIGRAVRLNLKLEEMVLGQAKETYWIVARSTRGLWDQVELKTDLAPALISGERISELNPNKQIVVLLQIKSFFESGLERIP